MKLKQYIGLTCMLIVLTSCEKLLEIDPPRNEQSSSLVYRSEETAKSALAGAYYQMSGTQSINLDLTLVNAVASDEMRTAVAQFSDIITNNYNPITTTRTGGFWTALYKAIYNFNSVIEGLTDNTSITASVVQQMMGEAKTMRAYCYFHLVNIYGDVPLITTTNVDVNALMSRTAASMVYAQIVQDLEEAKGMLAEEYVVNGTASGRLQVNKWAATALLARIYLHTGEYAGALSNASEVIGQTGLYGLASGDELSGVFLKDSREAILQLGSSQNATSGFTAEGGQFVPTAIATAANYYLSPELLEAFEDEDKRKEAWVLPLTLSGGETFQPYKYQNNTAAAATASGRIEAPTLLRLAEQYLIRAEARMRQGDTEGARADVNTIRVRAGLDELSPSANLEDAIIQERRIELFCELGDRWYTLKRSGKVDDVMSQLRPDTWQSYAQWYPIPQTARDTNPNLTQNDGYIQ